MECNEVQRIKKNRFVLPQLVEVFLCKHQSIDVYIRTRHNYV